MTELEDEAARAYISNLWAADWDSVEDAVYDQAEPVVVFEDTEYLRFIETADTGKTKVWDVLSRSRGNRLAVIKWHGPWRQYVMYPEHPTLWNVGCLSDIQSFITARMAERRVPVPELEHIPPDETRPRMEFEVMHGISYCRRCGRLMAKDSDPEWTTSKPCQLVRVGLR